MKRTLLAGLATGMMILSMAGLARATTIALPSTGQGLINSGDLDLNWKVNGNPAQLLTRSSPNWYPEWLANDSNSQWIGVTDENVSNGYGYSFVLSFDLSSFDLSTVSLDGAWTIDDQGSLKVNGHEISSLPSVEWSTLHSFSLAANSGYLNSGLNTLEITLGDTDNYLEGVRLQGSINGDVKSPTPEPASMVLLGTGLVALAGARRRKKQQQLA